MRTLKGSVGSDHLCQGAQIGPCKPVCFTLQRALVWDLRITLTTAQVSEMLVHSFRDACPCWVLATAVTHPKQPYSACLCLRALEVGSVFRG